MMTIRPGDFWVADIPFTVEGGPLLMSVLTAQVWSRMFLESPLAPGE